MLEIESIVYDELRAIGDYVDGMTYRVMDRLHTKPTVNVDDPIPENKLIELMKVSLELYQGLTPKLSDAVATLNQCRGKDQIRATMALIESILVDMSEISVNFQHSTFSDDYQYLMLVGRSIFNKPINDTLYFFQGVRQALRSIPEQGRNPSVPPLAINLDMETAQETSAICVWLDTQIKVKNYKKSTLGCGIIFAALIAGIVLVFLFK